jgi:regulator of CtrA degradation
MLTFLVDALPTMNAQPAAPAFFSRTYDEALAMLRETRDYLTGRGKMELKGLHTEAALDYSRESMRLTARLTQVMAWLLLQRAVHVGEISAEEARQPEHRLSGQDICLAPSGGLEHLPGRLINLLERSDSLYRRIERLDQLAARAGERPLRPLSA